MVRGPSADGDEKRVRVQEVEHEKDRTLRPVNPTTSVSSDPCGR